MHSGCCSTFGKRKNTPACGSSIFTLSESLAISLVHESRNPARKTIRYSFILLYAFLSHDTACDTPLVTLVTLQYVIPDQTPPTPTSVTYFVNGLIKLLTISLLLSKQCFCFKEVKVNQTQLSWIRIGMLLTWCVS
jgi:hypothetical protein